MPEKPYRVLLYYQFVKIDDPAAFAAQHLQLCKLLGLKGRIIVAEEGINGTVSGLVSATETYKAALHNDPRFASMEFKEDEHDTHAFKKIFVRHRDEIITMGLHLKNRVEERTGKHVEPAEFREMILRDDVVVLDGRNDYEYDLGHFRGAIRPEFENFKQVPSWLRSVLPTDRHKPIVTYCTGGIRCEKLTSYLLEEGYENVFQLNGGIVSYGKDPAVRGDLFDGQCFVFDERISVPINSTASATVVARCLHCGSPSENYVNCANVLCNELYICCEECEEREQRCCKDQCKDAVHRDKGQKLDKRAASSGAGKLSNTGSAEGG